MSSGPAFQSRYERYALIFDPTQASRLGAEALGLVERGIDPLYANDVDEVHLMALQETGRVGALVVPGALSLATLDVLIDRIAPQLWAGARSVVVVGPPDDRAALRELEDRGISWVLREPYDASEFRFVVAAALATEDKLDPRGGLRVPLTIAISVRHGAAAAEGLVRNLSIGGAYVALATSAAAGLRDPRRAPDRRSIPRGRRDGGLHAAPGCGGPRRPGAGDGHRVPRSRRGRAHERRRLHRRADELLPPLASARSARNDSSTPLPQGDGTSLPGRRGDGRFPCKIKRTFASERGMEVALDEGRCPCGAAFALAFGRGHGARSFG